MKKADEFEYYTLYAKHKGKNRYRSGFWTATSFDEAYARVEAIIRIANEQGRRGTMYQIRAGHTPSTTRDVVWMGGN